MVKEEHFFFFFLYPRPRPRPRDGSIGRGVWDILVDSKTFGQTFVDGLSKEITYKGNNPDPSHGIYPNSLNKLFLCPTIRFKIEV